MSIPRDQIYNKYERFCMKVAYTALETPSIMRNLLFWVWWIAVFILTWWGSYWALAGLALVIIPAHVIVTLCTVIIRDQKIDVGLYHHASVGDDEKANVCPTCLLTWPCPTAVVMGLEEVRETKR